MTFRRPITAGALATSAALSLLALFAASAQIVLKAADVHPEGYRPRLSMWLPRLMGV